MKETLFNGEKRSYPADKSKTLRPPLGDFIQKMNESTFKSIVAILFVTATLLSGCKKESQPSEDPLPNFSVINGFNDTTGYVNVARGVLGLNDALYAKYYKAVFKDTTFQTFWFNIIDLKGRDTLYNFYLNNYDQWGLLFEGYGKFHGVWHYYGNYFGLFEEKP
jgi:hypothetical protein